MRGGEEEWAAHCRPRSVVLVHNVDYHAALEVGTEARDAQVDHAARVGERVLGRDVGLAAWVDDRHGHLRLAEDLKQGDQQTLSRRERWHSLSSRTIENGL